MKTLWIVGGVAGLGAGYYAWKKYKERQEAAASGGELSEEEIEAEIAAAQASADAVNAQTDEITEEIQRADPRDRTLVQHFSDGSTVDKQASSSLKDFSWSDSMMLDPAQGGF